MSTSGDWTARTRPIAAHRSTAGQNYRITGRLGTAHYLSFQVNEGMANHGNIRGDQLELEPDGSFILWVGPEARTGNWMPTPPGADFLIVRQFFYDWSTEEPADARDRARGRPRRFAGQTWRTPMRPPRTGWPGSCRRSPPGSTPVPGSGSTSRSWARCRIATDSSRPPPSRSRGERSRTSTGGGISTWPRTMRSSSMCSPPTPCYWSVHLGNFWWESLDYCYRHTSLNGFQAELDADGRFRAVIAHQDPGVANWLDTCGHARGPMLFRWIVADHAPDPTCTVVPFSRVREHLPDTTRPVSPVRAPGHHRPTARRGATPLLPVTRRTGGPEPGRPDRRLTPLLWRRGRRSARRSGAGRSSPATG